MGQLHSAVSKQTPRQDANSGIIFCTRNKAIFKSLITLNPAKYEPRFARLRPIALLRSASGTQFDGLTLCALPRVMRAA